jgi:hypothetical protein
MRVALSLTVLVAGCVQHRDIKEAHELVGEGDVIVALVDGRRVAATAAESGGYVTFVAKSGETLRFEQIVRVSGKDRMQGATQGLGLGALGGAVAGLVIGVRLSDSDDDCDNSNHASSNCGFAAFDSIGDGLLGAVVGAAGGGLIGAVLGAVAGGTVIYENTSRHTTVRVDGPAGSVVGISVDF